MVIRLASFRKIMRRSLNRKTFGSQSAFTIVEMLVASIILVTGLLATLGMLYSASLSNETTERRQVAVGIVQRALEETADLRFDQLSLTSQPADSQDQDSPLSLVAGEVFKNELDEYESMVVGGQNAAVNPGPETVDVDGVSAKVYRFITWVDAPTYEGCTQNCDNSQDYKRITIAVKAANPNNQGFTKYVLASTLRIDPLLGPEGQVTQPPDPNPTESHDNFFLYDTPNDNCSSTTYQEPSSDHVTNDTLEQCEASSGKYPDLMGTTLPLYTSAPELPYTYSTDLPGSYDGGLAIQRVTTCALGESEELTKFQIHSWSTNTLSADYKLSGMMSFDFWTAMVGQTTGDGKICVWLYDWNLDGDDELITDGSPSPSYAMSSWPGSLTNLSFTFSHRTYTVPGGHRLRFVLAVSSQSDSDIQFAYDHPAYTSFVQIRTTTPITQ